MAACGGGDDTATTTAKPVATQTSGGGSTAAPTQAGSTSAATAPASTANGSGAGADDVCSLISQDQIASITTNTVSAGRKGAANKSCDWDGMTPGFSLAVEIDTSSTAAEIYAASSNDAGVVAVDGIGDKAQWNSSLLVLEVLKGGNDITIQLVDIQGTSGTEDNAKAVANIIVPKI
ncbi:MAG: hypothetical protein ABI559_02245 [Chloroflexota bacterium]